MLTREEMMDMIIRRYGFENHRTIYEKLIGGRKMAYPKEIREKCGEIFAARRNRSAEELAAVSALCLKLDGLALQLFRDGFGGGNRLLLLEDLALLFACKIVLQLGACGGGQTLGDQKVAAVSVGDID